MSMRYMLDTNICIYLIKRHPPRVIDRLEALRRGEAIMSAITYAELRTGIEMQGEAHRADDERALALLVESIPVLPFDEAAAVGYGVIRAAVRERNRDALDRLIAAHALSVGAVLVTNNEADFLGYPGLQVENWAAASPV
jgi:tRNA(fMet)-specific endonuclease VapC